MKKKWLTDYKNFWLIWLTAASNPKGSTLFKIQKHWKISTNYLYHKESGLEKSLFKEMIAQGYLREDKNKIFAEFNWLSDYILLEYKHKAEGRWSPNLFIINSWPEIQKFIEKHQSTFFKIDNLKTLFKNDITIIRKIGFNLVSNIVLILMILNIIPFCKKYNANVVIRMLYTTLAMDSTTNLYGYFNAVKPFIEKDPEFPVLIPDEKVLVKVLAPL